MLHTRSSWEHVELLGANVEVQNRTYQKYQIGDLWCELNYIDLGCHGYRDTLIF